MDEKKAGFRAGEMDPYRDFRDLSFFVMLVLPLVVVVTQALSKGWQCYVQAVTDEYTLKALKLTIGATAAAVVCNTIFGLCAAWAMTRFHFRGKSSLPL